MGGGPRRTLVALAFALALTSASAAPFQAQESPPFLLLNQERILTGSQVGQALLAEEEAARDVLRAEAREIDRRFEEEERLLTERREELAPEQFRELADAFDERVIEARREQDARSTTLVLEFEQRRRQFYADVAPILVRMLSQYGAHAIFDESSVLLADQSLNITDAVIAEIDASADEEDGREDGPRRAPPDIADPGLDPDPDPGLEPSFDPEFMPEIEPELGEE